MAARPSMGKTSLVLNIAQYVAAQPNQTVGFFSLEMSKESLFLRLLTSEAHIDSHRLMSGAIGQKDYGRIAHALETMSAMRLFIDDTAGIGVLEMRAKARRLQSEHGLNLLVVDYIQLMTGRGRFENRTLELASISRSLKGLAKELNVPIVVLSQLSRAPEARSDHRPQLSDLRECVPATRSLPDRRPPRADRAPGRPTPEVWSLPEGSVGRVPTPSGGRRAPVIVYAGAVDDSATASTGCSALRMDAVPDWRRRQCAVDEPVSRRRSSPSEQRGHLVWNDL